MSVSSKRQKDGSRRPSVRVREAQKANRNPAALPPILFQLPNLRADGPEPTAAPPKDAVDTVVQIDVDATEIKEANVAPPKNGPSFLEQLGTHTVVFGLLAAVITGAVIIGQEYQKPEAKQANASDVESDHSQLVSTETPLIEQQTADVAMDTAMALPNEMAAQTAETAQTAKTASIEETAAGFQNLSLSSAAPEVIESAPAAPLLTMQRPTITGPPILDGNLIEHVPGPGATDQPTMVTPPAVAMTESQVTIPPAPETTPSAPTVVADAMPTADVAVAEKAATDAADTAVQSIEMVDQTKQEAASSLAEAEEALAEKGEAMTEKIATAESAIQSLLPEEPTEPLKDLAENTAAVAIPSPAKNDVALEIPADEELDAELHAALMDLKEESAALAQAHKQSAAVEPPVMKTAEVQIPTDAVVSAKTVAAPDLQGDAPMQSSTPVSPDQALAEILKPENMSVALADEPQPKTTPEPPPAAFGLSAGTPAISASAVTPPSTPIKHYRSSTPYDVSDWLKYLPPAPQR